MLGASTITLSSQSDFSDEDELAISLDGNWQLKGSSVLSASMIIADDAFYMNSPELYPDTLAFSLEDLGFDEVSSPLDLLNMRRYGYGYYSPVVQSDSIIALSKYTTELKSMFRTLAKAAAAELPFELDKNAVLSVNDKQVRLHAVTLDFSERDMSRAMTAALETLRDSDEYLELLSRMSRDFSDLTGVGSMNKSNIKRQIEELIGEMRYASSSQTIGTVMLYVDAANKPAGVFLGVGDVGSGGGNAYSADRADYDPGSNGVDATFALAPVDAPYGGNFVRTATELGYESEMGFAAVLGEGFELYYADDYNSFRVYGDLNGGIGSANGTINLSYSDGYDDIDVPLGTFSGLSFKEHQGVKTPNFTWKFAMEDILGELALQNIIGDEADSFKNITGELKFTASGNQAAVSLKIEDGRDASILIESSGHSGDVNINISAPSGRDVVYMRSAYDLDGYALLDNLGALAEKLEDMGFDVYDLFYEFDENIRYML
jgi:hypothetical protein